MSFQKKSSAIILSIGSIITFIFILGLLSQFKHFFPSKFERFTHGLIGLIAAIISVWIFLKYEKKPFSTIGLIWQKDTFKKFIIGLFIGALIAAIMVVAQVTISGLKITLAENYNIASFLFWSSALIPLAFMEEIAFRSYPFIKLNKVFGFRITQIIIALLFALYHIANGWSVGLSFLGPGILALVFGFLAKISDGISMPTGLHYGVNLLLAAISGQKGIEGVLTIDFPTEVSKSVIIENQNVGFVIQIALLIVCLVVTEIYLRNKKSKDSNIYYTRSKE